jgi:hypothetical protein
MQINNNKIEVSLSIALALSKRWKHSIRPDEMIAGFQFPQPGDRKTTITKPISTFLAGPESFYYLPNPATELNRNSWQY